MTSLDDRARLDGSRAERESGPTDDAEAPRPIGVASLIAALWAMLIGLIVVVIPVLIGWAVAPGPASDPAEALRTSVHVWAAAHQIPVDLGGVTISLLPLGLFLLPASLLFIVGSWAARATAPRGLGDAFLLSTATALAYGFMAALVNAWAATDSASSEPWRMFIGAAGVAWIVVTLAVLRTSGFLPVLIATIPRRWRGVIAGSAAGLAVIFAGSALLAAIVLARQLDEAGGSYSALKSGVVGTVLLTIVAIGYVPNVILWTASFAAGPGFSVGTGTQVTVAASDTAALPVFPLVAALPSDGAPPIAAALVMLLPMLAGVVVGVIVARRMRETAPEEVAGWSAAAGAIAGVALGVLAQISGGSLGDGRLSAVGPSGWRVGLMTAVALAVTAAAAGWFASRRRYGPMIVLPTSAAIDTESLMPTHVPVDETSPEVPADDAVADVPEPAQPATPIDVTLTAPITFTTGGNDEQHER